MILKGNFVKSFADLLPGQTELSPWEITSSLAAIITDHITYLDHHYISSNGVAIHTTAVIEKGAVIKAPAIIGAHCFIGANAYLRDGVYLDRSIKIGTGCEIKTSIIFHNSAIAHFNFIGDSIIGSDVNFEAGSVTANHFNEKENKIISVIYNGAILSTGVTKFGSMVGDHSKIGANAVLSPGTILPPASIVKRLELVDQLNYFITKNES